MRPNFLDQVNINSKFFKDFKSDAELFEGMKIDQISSTKLEQSFNRFIERKVKAFHSDMIISFFMTDKEYAEHRKTKMKLKPRVYRR